MRRLPDSFRLGAATAAFQIEGASHEDGRTDSIWDAFCRVPGAVRGGDDGSVACDHYHRHRDDVALMRDLGVQTYRFSTSWARIRPDGGAVNQAGLDFYRRLVDELLEVGIEPWLTLYHWDLPQALEERGGWRERDTAYRFADYARTVSESLGAAVPTYTTLNEPWCSSFLSYTGGEHAPGGHSPRDGVVAGHHLLLAHGLAMDVLRETVQESRLGITLNQTLPDPVDPSDAGDVDAARRIDGQFNRFFLDPIFRGEYAADLVEDLAGLGLDDVVRDGDLEQISRPIDVLGVNYYNGEAVSAHPPAEPVPTVEGPSRAARSPYPAADGVHVHSRGLPRTAMGWEVQPEGLTRTLVRLAQDYATPAGVELVVTENGAAFDDELVDGAVHDEARTAFLQDHLHATLDAIDQGAPVTGFLYWSLMDNFEWAYGYSKRFGIVHVDYESLERTVKDSGRRFAEIAVSREV